jgi:hypothetical protein
MGAAAPTDAISDRGRGGAMSMTLTRELLLKHKGDARVFVETGTADGRGVQLALDCGFEEVHSIEMSESLAVAARRQFENDGRVKVWLGDSGVTLAEVLGSIPVREELGSRAVVFLDAHAVPGLPETASSFPLERELEALLRAPYRAHTVIVDDVQYAGSPTLPGPRLRDILVALGQVNDGYEFKMERKNTILVARVPCMHTLGSPNESPTSDPFEFFDAIYCINLDTRPDRWKQAMREFAALGIAGRVERVAAVVHADAEEGCRLSHLECVRRATAAGAETALIFEDDVAFPEFSPDSLARSLDRLRAVPDWELFYLGGLVAGHASELDEDLVRAPMLQNHAYAIHRRAYAKMQSCDAPIDFWYARSMKSYLAKPVLAWQRDGFSDIQRTWTSRATDAKWMYARFVTEARAPAIVLEFARRNLRRQMFRARVRDFPRRLIRLAARIGAHLGLRRSASPTRKT